jgi:hypothetical protein
MYPGPFPSNFAWPTILGNKLNYETINLSNPGSSNIRMIYNILNTKFEEGDLVIVLWSYLTRDSFFNYNEIKNFGEWDNMYFETIKKLSSENDITIKNLMDIYFVTKHLESLNVKFYYMYLDKLNEDNVYPAYIPVFETYRNYIEKYNISKTTIDKVSDDSHKEDLGLALDNSHPSEKYQERLGNYIYETIKNEI